MTNALRNTAYQLNLGFTKDAKSFTDSLPIEAIAALLKSYLALTQEPTDDERKVVELPIALVRQMAMFSSIYLSRELVRRYGN